MVKMERKVKNKRIRMLTKMVGALVIVMEVKMIVRRLMVIVVVME